MWVATLSTNTVKHPSEQVVNVFGPHCSGTNLVTKLFDGTDQNLWKHTSNKSALTRLVTDGGNHKHLFVYRDIHSWLNSVRRTPYETGWNGDVAQKLHRYGMREGDQPGEGDQPARSMTPIELYVHLYSVYEELVRLYPDSCALVSYYDLLDPVTGYHYYTQIASALGIEPRSKWFYADVLAAPSKPHGHCVNSSTEALANRSNITLPRKTRRAIQSYKLQLEQLSKSLFRHPETDTLVQEQVRLDFRA